jgi:hypothetical protein
MQWLVRIQNKDDLFVALHPREASFTINDVVLNGMEVFKLSNSDPESMPFPPIEKT